MEVSGSCHCGAIRFEAEVDPKRVGLCHCKDCQVFSGSAFRIGVLVLEENFRMIEGKPTIYEKTAESGARRELAFCNQCGTHVYGVSSGEGKKSYSIRVGTLAQRAELTPVARVWCRSAFPWVDHIDEMHRVETQ